MSRITLITAYYENPKMLAVQASKIAEWYIQIRNRFDWIIVDDGSEKYPAIKPQVPSVNVELYRCLVNIPWNQDFCRNLAVSQAKTDWVLMTDMDHVVPEATATALVQGNFKPDVAYRFERVSAPSMAPYHPHPNSWFMTKQLFDFVGGYDERFAGYYGSDGEFSDRVKKVAPIIGLMQTLVRYPRSLVDDASTTTLERKSDAQKNAIRRIKHKIREQNLKPIRLQSPWEKVG